MLSMVWGGNRTDSCTGQDPFHLKPTEPDWFPPILRTVPMPTTDTYSARAAPRQQAWRTDVRTVAAAD